MLDGIIHRTTLADITGAMALVANVIEDAINNPALSDEYRNQIIDNALEGLDLAQVPLAEKIEACSFMRKSREGEIEAIKREEQRLRARRQALEAQAERWDTYIRRCLEVVRKVKLPLCCATLVDRKNDRLIIDDDSLIPSIKKRPDLWQRFEPGIRKDVIKEALKAGQVIPGAHLEDVRFIKWS